MNFETGALDSTRSIERLRILWYVGIIVFSGDVGQFGPKVIVHDDLL